MSEQKESRPSKVYLVGSGPGSAQLLTLRAVELLRRCDVVLHDRLIQPDVLDYAKQAVSIPVGKRSGSGAAQRQKEILRLMIHYARAGCMTVRLKGGDPFIFGRGGEEALGLIQAGISFEVVPGVSSFHAAPGLFGIPLTHRGLSSAFAVFTAHEAEDGKTSGIPWAIAARMPTAVFLMGLRNLSYIVAKLSHYGRSSHTPVAVISNASWPEQKIAVGVLGDIVQRAAMLKAPAIVIVGEVVSLQAALSQKRQLERQQERKTESSSGASLHYQTV